MEKIHAYKIFNFKIRIENFDLSILFRVGNFLHANFRISILKKKVSKLSQIAVHRTNTEFKNADNRYNL
jgi:hypothetical protein